MYWSACAPDSGAPCRVWPDTTSACRSGSQGSGLRPGSASRQGLSWGKSVSVLGCLQFPYPPRGFRPYPTSFPEPVILRIGKASRAISYYFTH